MENEIFIKLAGIKDILIKKIKTFEDYNSNKNIIINGIEEIEKILKELFNIKEENNFQEINEPNENINNEQSNLNKEKEENPINENERKNEISNEKKENNKKEEINNNEEIKIQIEDGEILNEKEKEIKQDNLKEEKEIKNKDNNIKEEEIDNKENNFINNNEINPYITFQQKNDKKEINPNLKIEIQEEEYNDNDNDKYSLPKLNFDYDKNLNEILNDINLDQNKPSLKSSVDYDKSRTSEFIKDDFSKNKTISTNNEIIKNISKKKEGHKKNEESPIHYLIKNKNDQIIKEINNEEANKINDIKISNLQNNGYSDLFSFNQDLSNINNKSTFTTDEYSTKKNKINLKKREEDLLNNNNIKNINTNNTFQSEDNIKTNNNKQNKSSLPTSIAYENENNSKTSKALRVADIIMKINSNDILYEIITQVHSKDILNQLMSPKVDINLINRIEQDIENITILENEEIEKLNNKQKLKDKNLNNSENINNKEINIYNINSDIYDINKKSNLNNINNFNKVNLSKKKDEYNNHRTSFSFYDKSNSSCYSQLPPKIPPNRQLNKYKAEYLNSEILQNYPKTGKTILGYEKFKRDKNREFNFERSLRNDNYLDIYKNKKTYNFNISKAESIGKNQSCHSNNRSFSSKKVIFNNYTSPFGDYFDSSLQKGGESKLKIDYPKNNNNILFKNCRSPVKDYIDGINDIYI